MVTFKILRQLKPSGKKWKYQGRIIHNAKTIDVTGIVDDYLTNSQIKRAIINDIKKKTKKYIASIKSAKAKKLSGDSVFKDTL